MLKAARAGKTMLQANLAGRSQQELSEVVTTLSNGALRLHTVYLESLPRSVIIERRGGGALLRSMRGTKAMQHSLCSDAHLAVTTAVAEQLHTRVLRGKLLAALVKLLAANKVQHLELGVKLLGASAFAMLERALAANSSLQVLSFAGSSMGDAAVQALRPALMAHPKLRCLDLSGCALSDQSAAALAMLLHAQSCRRSQAAWVRGLRANDAGAPDVGAQGLLQLNLSNNQITDKGAAELAGALEEDPGLQTLNLARNRLSPVSAALFTTLLEQSTATGLEEVDLRHNFPCGSRAEAAGLLLRRGDASACTVSAVCDATLVGLTHATRLAAVEPHSWAASELSAVEDATRIDTNKIMLSQLAAAAPPSTAKQAAATRCSKRPPLQPLRMRRPHTSAQLLRAPIAAHKAARMRISTAGMDQQPAAAGGAAVASQMLMRVLLDQDAPASAAASLWQDVEGAGDAAGRSSSPAESWDGSLGEPVFMLLQGAQSAFGNMRGMTAKDVQSRLAAEPEGGPSIRSSDGAECEPGSSAAPAQGCVDGSGHGCEGSTSGRLMAGLQHCSAGSASADGSTPCCSSAIACISTCQGTSSSGRTEAAGQEEQHLPQHHPHQHQCQQQQQQQQQEEEGLHQEHGQQQEEQQQEEQQDNLQDDFKPGTSHDDSPMSAHVQRQRQQQQQQQTQRADMRQQRAGIHQQPSVLPGRSKAGHLTASSIRPASTTSLRTPRKTPHKRSKPQPGAATSPAAVSRHELRTLESMEQSFSNLEELVQDLERTLLHTPPAAASTVQQQDRQQEPIAPGQQQQCLAPVIEGVAAQLRRLHGLW